ncbi:helix-turn-helix transcriptional regulator [Paenalkalicoccus suaedae]|uniref:Helix-turn-helix transcriptional regulator n=1 Tax=Paenalkalicoccus suaedae TaxID=2592382 RepID=A0A859FFS3_9BACI|nr:helix-turn-helix transcriptional regulator [Paenalkalicoccus suaedae]QKS71957.1 helix-turn-helix transcriptional regulator [Paenalkalicoccus suaedae]
MDSIYIRAVRHYLNMTQDDLGSLLGTSKTSLSLIENGHRPISSRTQARLLQIFTPDERFEEFLKNYRKLSK